MARFAEPVRRTRSFSRQVHGSTVAAGPPGMCVDRLMTMSGFDMARRTFAESIRSIFTGSAPIARSRAAPVSPREAAVTA